MIEKVLFTPEKAQELLRMNYKGQRSINAAWVKNLSAQMVDGNWNEDIVNPTYIRGKDATLF